MVSRAASDVSVPGGDATVTELDAGRRFGVDPVVLPPAPTVFSLFGEIFATLVESVAERLVGGGAATTKSSSGASTDSASTSANSTGTSDVFAGAATTMSTDAVSGTTGGSVTVAVDAAADTAAATPICLTVSAPIWII